MRHSAFPNGVARADLLAWFREGRARSKQMLEIPIEEAYYERPISLRNPIVFYEGHLPAFDVNTLIKLALKRDGIDPAFETLFARGIDPDTAPDSAEVVWPSRDDVQAYGRDAEDLIVRAMCDGPIDDAL